MLPSLYQLSNEYQQAATTLATLDIDEQTLADTLEGMAGNLEVKAQNVAMVARNLEALAMAIKQAEKGMADRRKAIEARADKVRQYIQDCMERAGISKIECPYFALAIRENPPTVIIDDASQLPNEYLRVPPLPEPEPDKKAILAAIKDGKAVPGAHVERRKKLEIK